MPFQLGCGLAGGFNGAALLRARSDQLNIPPFHPVDVLQRGRAFEGAE